MQGQNCKIIIGSYPYRGNVNLCRMVCEYVDMPYQNLFFNPCSWKIYKEKNTYDWNFQELPFLIDDDLVITQAFPMCEYVIKKSGHISLLGKNIGDALIVDSFIWGKDLIQNLLSLVVENKNNPKKLMEQMHSSWLQTIKAQLLQYEKHACCNSFYLGYLTIIDFLIHQIFEHYKGIFRSQIASFPKLLAIREKVAALPKIREFQSSNRTVLEMCPLQFYKKWKMEAMKTGAQIQLTSP